MITHFRPPHRINVTPNPEVINRVRIEFASSFDKALHSGLSITEMRENLAHHEESARRAVGWHFTRRHCYRGDHDRARAREEIRRLREDFQIWKILLDEKARAP